MEKRRSVAQHSALIPIIELGNNGDVTIPPKNLLLEVHAAPYQFGDDTDDLARKAKQKEIELKAIDKDWDRVAAPLRKVNVVLYRSGCVAAGAVRKLGLKQPRLALYQWIKPQAWLEQQRLYSSSYPEELSEGNSAELGLALVLLMAASGSPYRQVIATGKLSGQTQLIRERDVKILPVSKLEEKFNLVIQQVTQGQLPRDKELLFFIPKYCNQGESAVEVENRPEVQILRTLGIQVILVEWLSEAAEKLKANTARYLLQDLILKWFIIVLLVMSLSWVSWLGWQDRAISMKFVAANPVTLSAEPFLVCFKGKKVHYQSIAREGIVPIVPITSTLGWQVKIGEANRFDSLLNQWFGYQGYYVAYLMISEFSAPMVNISDETGKVMRILPGQEWAWSWKLNEQAEENKLILLTQRGAFKQDQFQLLVNQPIESKTADLPMNITEIANNIESKFPNGLYFTFRTTKSKSQCTL
ncbi:hypothetical protein THII_0632 [Thioploca ingrica]|uniref:Uncharacterized protein n=1 Tax=Thioploca ingrica TaxID=40754 RepID=A0A090ADN0_9GAMM|nr:hypothetical protein THII_0632 [Thioploca ingrica]